MNDKFGEYNLYHFAYCGTDDSFYRKLENLSELAEQEIWGFDETNPLSILKIYIYRTFERCNSQNKILVSKDQEYACSNTGLLTPYGKDILMYFGRNLKEGVSPWYFRDFKVYTDREVMNHFCSVPELATYADDYEQLYFKPGMHMEVSYDHILDDNWERIHNEIPFDKAVVVNDGRTEILVVLIEDIYAFMGDGVFVLIILDVMLFRRVVVGNDVDVADVERAVFRVVLYPAVGIRRHHVQRQVDSLAVGGRVSCISDVFLVESEISLFAQAFGDGLPLFVEFCTVEEVVVVQQELQGILHDELVERIVGDIVADGVDVVRLFGKDVVVDYNFVPLRIDNRVDIHLRFQIAFVDERQFQLVG